MIWGTDEQETWDLYDADGNRTGEDHERGVPIPPDRYHIVISVWIRNSEGRYLMSRRRKTKRLYPDTWECTGGCAVKGETALEAAVREVREELGITLDPARAELIYHLRRDAWQDFYSAYLFETDIAIEDIHPQTSEVSEVRWMSRAEIDAHAAKGDLYPLIDYYPKVLR